MLEKVYVYSNETTTFPIHNGVYIHNLSNDEFYTVEQGVGTYIWSQMDGSKSVEQIIVEVCRLCREERTTIEKDICEFIQALLNKNIIEER